MYIAYGSVTNWFSSIYIHMDIADAQNAILYALSPSEGESGSAL